MIRFVDLQAQYLAIKAEVDEAVQRVVSRAAFIGGGEVLAFEREFAAFCGVKEAVGVGNGTDALYLALRAAGIGAGDEVITVSHTFIATAEAITLAGARPVFVDILADTMLMDPEAMERAITGCTRAVIPVHLYGQPCDMDWIMGVARKHNLVVIEDASQAHGARWKGRRAGSFGLAGCFSFYPGKNLGGFGDGGAVVSNDEAFLKKVRMLANHGRIEKYTHEMEGTNSRLDGIQAAVLGVKLRHLEEWNDARRRHVCRYREKLAGADLVLPVIAPGAESVWHLFVVRTPDRDCVRNRLKLRGVDSGVHYPIPLHLQPAYSYLGVCKGSLPVTEKAAAEVLSLPMYAELSPGQIDLIASAVSAG